MKPTSFTLPIGHYPFDVLFSFNQTDKEFEEELKKVKIEEFDDPCFTELKCRARTVSLDGGQTVVRFKDFSKTPSGYGILAHEIFHVVEMLFEQTRTPHSFDFTSEPYAYLIQHLTEKVYEKLGIRS